MMTGVYSTKSQAPAAIQRSRDLTTVPTIRQWTPGLQVIPRHTISLAHITLHAYSDTPDWVVEMTDPVS
jgi:hypothetical protein